MTGSSSEIIAAGLIGRSIDMVCINANQVYFHFGLKSYLVVEGEYRISSSGLDGEPIKRVPDLPPDVTKILDRVAIACSISDDRILKIHLQGGGFIEAFSDARGYEGYKVILDAKEVFSV